MTREDTSKVANRVGRGMCIEGTSSTWGQDASVRCLGQRITKLFLQLLGTGTDSLRRVLAESIIDAKIISPKSGFKSVTAYMVPEALAKVICRPA